MALPNENRTSKTDTVEAEIKKMGPKDLAGLPGLEEDDFRVFGTLIQHFCFIDLNLKRALEIFDLAKMLPHGAKKLYPNLPDAKLTETLVEIVNAMDGEHEDKATALTWMEVISKTRGYRNLVSHFAGKRFSGHDVYVFASKSDKDARKVLGLAWPSIVFIRSSPGDPNSLRCSSPSNRLSCGWRKEYLSGTSVI